jgi:hypothetical protein
MGATKSAIATREQRVEGSYADASDPDSTLLDQLAASLEYLMQCYGKLGANGAAGARPRSRRPASPRERKPGKLAPQPTPAAGGVRRALPTL